MASLRERLQRLRASTGLPQATSADARPQDQFAGDVGTGDDISGQPSLAERIRRLSTAGPTRIRTRPTSEVIAERLGAELIAPGLLRLERYQPLTQRHGRFQPAQGPAYLATESARQRLLLSDLAPLVALAPPSQLADPRHPTNPEYSSHFSPRGWTFIDTETSGLAGGTGTWAFVIGLAQIQGADLRIRQYLLLELDAEPALMARVQTELAAANPLISYNGKRFDLPLLETRLRLNGLPGLPESPPHLDLLYPIRRAFATRWPDCRLASCEQRLLGFERADDLPGAEAPGVWLDWLRAGDPGRLGAVLRHNRYDLLSLAALIPALIKIQQEPLTHGADLMSLARQLERRGQALMAEHWLDEAIRDLEPEAVLLLARLKRRRGAWSEAVSLWQQLAMAGVVEALLALAKYEEHVNGDLAQALAYAERLPATEAHRHRQARLRRRLALKQTHDGAETLRSAPRPDAPPPAHRAIGAQDNVRSDRPPD